MRGLSTRCVLVLLLLAPSLVSAQSLTLIATGPPGIGVPIVQIEGYPIQGHSNGSAAWADFDRDGFQDFLGTGLRPTVTLSPGGFIVNQNNRPPTTFLTLTEYQVIMDVGPRFIMRAVPLSPGIVHGEAAWADYDNDGDLDAALTGSLTNNPPYQPITRLLLNQNGATLSPVDPGLSGTSFGSLNWGDYDNDGDPDLLITGILETGEHSARLYRNDRTAGFTDSGIALPGLAYSAADWGDYDADGDLDLVLSGAEQGGAFRSYLFENDGAGGLVQSNAALPELAFGSVEWGDYDNDGDLDLLMSGANYSVFLVSANIVVLRNDGGSFTQIDTGITGTFYGEAAWGDYDVDGRLDILAAGHPRAGTEQGVLRGFRNLGGDQFENRLPTGFYNEGLLYASVSSMDIDTDGDIDASVMGVDENDLVHIRPHWNNGLASNNRPPTAPSNLSARFEGNDAIFSWDAATDAETPEAGLSYNLRVSTMTGTGPTPGAADIVNPLSEPVTGRRWVSEPGNVGGVTEWRLRDLPPGRYFWSVQAIDASFAPSAFAQEVILDSNGGGGGDDTTPPAAPQALAARTGDNVVFLSWSANTEDDLGGYRIYRDEQPGAQTLLDFVPGADTQYTDEAVIEETTYYYRLTAVDASGNESDFSSEVQATPRRIVTPLTTNLPRITEGTVVWGDYDADGDPDLFLSGIDDGFVRTDVYRNDGAGNFTPLGISFPEVFRGAAAWGDYDADGDLDLAINGDDLPIGGRVFTRIYRNENGAFSNIQADLSEVYGGTLDWADLDRDGDLDLALAGNFPSASPNRFPAGGEHRIYRNEDGAFGFVADVFDISRPQANLAWGDFNNDGDPDMVATDAQQSRLFINLDGVLLRTTTSFDFIPEAKPHPADFDNDGDLDLLISGQFNAALYRNEGSAQFTRIDAGIPNILNGVYDVGDYDNDGDLDIVIGAERNSIILENAGDGTFTEAAIDLPGIIDARVAWGDYDGDGDLDLLFIGSSLARIYELGFAPNTMPTPPDVLNQRVEGSNVELRWARGTDAETPLTGLTYNLRVGTTPGGSDVVSPMAQDDGRRLLPDQGNAGLSRSRRLQLEPGTYFWSVQSIDTSFSGSAFSEEQSFTISGSPENGASR